MLQTNNLSYSRNGRLLFSNLEFTVPYGSALIVTGPNGVGKSTLLRILSGLLLPTAGTIERQADTLIAYLGHKPGIYLQLTVLENLNYAKQFAALAESINFTQILQDYGLSTLQHTLAEKLSAGEKQRLALATVEVSAATLWILDEPLTALDELGSNLLQNKLQTHLDQGRGVIVASHQGLKLQPAHHLPLIFPHGHAH